jgi:hypothetical protein
MFYELGTGMHFRKSIIAIFCVTASLGGCTVAKVTGKAAALPFKAVYKTGEYTTKGVYYAGKGAGTVTYQTGMFAGKGVYYTGKGAYNVASVPVKVTNAALDTSVKVLTVTTQVVDLSGKVVTVSRTLQRSEVDAYVNQARGAANVLDILVDVYRG